MAAFAVIVVDVISAQTSSARDINETSFMAFSKKNSENADPRRNEVPARDARYLARVTRWAELYRTRLNAGSCRRSAHAALALRGAVALASRRGAEGREALGCPLSACAAANSAVCGRLFTAC